jgi:hypothetical protein
MLLSQVCTRNGLKSRSFSSKPLQQAKKMAIGRLSPISLYKGQADDNKPYIVD